MGLDENTRQGVVLPGTAENIAWRFSGRID